MIYQEGKQIESSTNYIKYFVAGKAISMSALPAPVIRNHGPIYNIPTVQCRSNPDASGSFSTHRQGRTTNNVPGIISLFIYMYKHTIQYTSIIIIYCPLAINFTITILYAKNLLTSFRKTSITINLLYAKITFYNFS